MLNSRNVLSLKNRLVFNKTLILILTETKTFNIHFRMFEVMTKGQSDWKYI